jgi:hypothetical protein
VLDGPARAAWRHAYQQLSRPTPGPAGAITARAEAHVIRLALLYALINGNTTITLEHLHAALALHDYAARSATWALQPTTGDPLAEQIHAALTHAPAGLTRTQLRDLFQRNLNGTHLAKALATLAHAGRASHQRVLTRRTLDRRHPRHHDASMNPHRPFGRYVVPHPSSSPNLSPPSSISASVNTRTPAGCC